MSRNTETVQEIYASFGRGDIHAILAKLREDIEWEHDALDNRHSGASPGSSPGGERPKSLVFSRLSVF